MQWQNLNFGARRIAARLCSMPTGEAMLRVPNAATALPEHRKNEYSKELNISRRGIDKTR
jgi:hypothetical protein